MERVQATPHISSELLDPARFLQSRASERQRLSTPATIATISPRDQGDAILLGFEVRARIAVAMPKERMPTSIPSLSTKYLASDTNLDS